MHPDCTHTGQGNSLVCDKCAAVRDSLDAPWRGLSAIEKKRNGLVHDLAFILINRVEKEWNKAEFDEVFGNGVSSILSGIFGQLDRYEFTIKKCR